MAKLWKLLFLALPAANAMAVPAAAHDCKVKVTLDDFKYEQQGDNIGMAWILNGNADLGKPAVPGTNFVLKAFKPGDTFTPKTPEKTPFVLLEKKLGVFKGQPVKFTIFTRSEATEISHIPNPTNTLTPSKEYNLTTCGVPPPPTVDFIEYVVPVMFGKRAAQIRFNYRVDIDP